MKVSTTLISVLAGLGAAAPQSDGTLQESLSRDLDVDVKNTLQKLVEKNKNPAKELPTILKDFGLQVGGSLPNHVGQGVSVSGLFASGDYSISLESFRTNMKNLGTTAMAFLPAEASPLGNLPGFMMLLLSLGKAVERYSLAEQIAKQDQKEACFSKTRTYKDICENCSPDLLVSVLGKLNNCKDEPAVTRDASKDQGTAKSLCVRSVLCRDYRQGGSREIKSKADRYDPLRGFWCRTKDEQIGLLLDAKLGQTLRSSLDTTDFEEFRSKLQQPCMDLLGDQAPVKCPTKAEIEDTNTRFPPINYCSK
ncbi:hypothetical protein HIM_07844 [Hirsutella minnesotensis 3608]|uniref:Uncharacterized protein n=1 Tax=Hirsutella minnesotensis 3608 TaxID=1043627 RepID=A0A0F8A411_9HYPO|nr:hypothetical protein HIM_07844 [Hirsutella minnesotensis 3608]